DPTSPNRLFIAGDSDPTSVEGDVWRVDVSSGTAWTQVTLAGAGNTAPHSDSRNMAFDASGSIIDVDDGGVYRLTNPNATNRAGVSLNGSGSNGLHVGEFWSVARDPVTGRMFGGLQDIGVVEQPLATNAGRFDWAYQPSGDGGVADVGGF